MSLLTGELEKLGFQVYIQNTGKYTPLIVEEERQAGGTICAYDFYKASFYKSYTSRIAVYEEHLAPSQLLKHVKDYIYYREKYLKGRRTIT